jgi:N-acetyl-gamma-glutamyl-phosphate reductase
MFTSEMSKGQREAVATSKRISNPGCYPTGFIGLTRPLTDAGLLASGTPVTVNAISGYSGGGKGLMKIFEESSDHEPWGTYGLGLSHKHVPEMALYSGLNVPPIFQPAVGDFPQGMVVSVPLHYAWFKDPDSVSGAKIHEVYKKHYEGSKFVQVMPYGESSVKDAGLLVRNAFLSPDNLRDTNQLQIFVFANDEQKQCLLLARLDNLGKGASGAAVQNLNIALGLDETAGLV